MKSLFCAECQAEYGGCKRVCGGWRYTRNIENDNYYHDVGNIVRDEDETRIVLKFCSLLHDDSDFSSKFHPLLHPLRALILNLFLSLSLLFIYLFPIIFVRSLNVFYRKTNYETPKRNVTKSS